jgi:hypothetical protein
MTEGVTNGREIGPARATSGAHVGSAASSWDEGGVSGGVGVKILTVSHLLSVDLICRSDSLVKVVPRNVILGNDHMFESWLLRDSWPKFAKIAGAVVHSSYNVSGRPAS